MKSTLIEFNEPSEEERIKLKSIVDRIYEGRGYITEEEYEKEKMDRLKREKK